MTLAVLARLAVLTALWRVQPSEPAPAPTWRIVETARLHLGVRPAFANEGAGLTVQVSFATPW